MPEWLRKLFGVRTAVQSGREDPVLHAAVAESALIYQRIPLCEFVDEATRRKLSRQLYLLMSGVSRSIDPIMVGRAKLIAAMLEFAMYQVLVIPPPPESDPSELRGRPGISGQLREHVFTLASKNDELCSILRGAEQPLTADGAWDFVLRSYWTCYWFLESLNAVRIELGDCREAEDWYRPFMHAACAHREHLYRRELALPPSFATDEADAIATAYSILTDIILSGAEDPVGEWCEYYQDSNIPCPD